MRRAVWVGGAIAVFALTAGALVSIGGGGDDGAQAQPQATATARVERRDLVDRETVDGTLGFADARAVVAGVAGTVTWLPDEGSVVRRGEHLADVNESPVTLLYGNVPAWRTLTLGVNSGEDVRQLERNLVAMGYGRTDVDVDRSFDAHTAEALRDWQDDVGLEPTGSLAAGSFVFLPGPRRVGAHATSVGAAAAPGVALYGSTSTDLEVAVDLDATRRDLVAEGDEVLVTMPDDNDRTGVVSTVGAVAEGDPADPTATATVAVTIRLRGAAGAGGLDGAPVDVGFTDELAVDALAAPVTALLALLEGGYAVEVVQPDGSSSLVAVEPGLFADGWVELEGDVEAGAQVVVPA